ncbi:MAG TPA: diaminopimelate epimerase [Terriglobales bacterium]|nr:diaminopimelate epimerase [Terriglobales bacterium]
MSAAEYQSSSTIVPFTKASACGNDFLIVEGKHASGELSVISRRMCDRHYGVGADGVEWVFPDAKADVAARLINADGSEAEVSGNGTRCVAAEICSRQGKDKKEVVVMTGAGLKSCRLIARRGSTFEFEADMGVPDVGGELAIEAVAVVGMKVSMGNPHYVIFVESFPDSWQKQGALIGTQQQFPQGTNVEYAVVRGPHEIEIRLFERGVGETLSSGTGSCASAVAAVASGRVTSPVTVVAPGGPQVVRWEKHVFLRGPATLVCRGEFFV